MGDRHHLRAGLIRWFALPAFVIDVSLQMITGGRAAGHVRTELPEPGFRLYAARGLIEMRVEDPDGIRFEVPAVTLSAVAPAIGATAGTTNLRA